MYVTDYNNEYDNINQVLTELQDGLFNGSLISFDEKTSENFKWEDDLKINKSDAKEEDFDKYFVKNEVVLVNHDSEEWEQLYINGKSVDSGHTLNEGEERIVYFLKLSKKYGFDLEDIKYAMSNDIEDFPEYLDEFYYLEYK